MDCEEWQYFVSDAYFWRQLVFQVTDKVLERLIEDEDFVAGKSD